MNPVRLKPFVVTETDVGACTLTNANTSGSFDYSMLTFDPSGTIANSTFPPVGGAGGNLATMPNFVTYALLYKFYKVTKLQLTVRYKNAVSAGVNLFNVPIEMFYRWEYDANAPVGPGSLWFEQAENTRHFRFTPERPEHIITIIPKVQKMELSSAGLAGLTTQGLVPRKMGWTSTDINGYATLWGLKLFVPYIPVGAELHFDVTYHCQFKGKK